MRHALCKVSCKTIAAEGVINDGDQKKLECHEKDESEIEEEEAELMPWRAIDAKQSH